MTTTIGEVKIRAPPDFTGERVKAKQFISSCELYFAVNAAVYDTDMKKVVFALSFMTAGAAAAWKEQKLALYTAAGTTWPWGAFKTDFTTAFSAVSDKVTAKMDQLMTTSQHPEMSLEDLASPKKRQR
jgi:hypothetical protein